MTDIYTLSSVSIAECRNVITAGAKWLILLQDLVQKS